MDILSVHSLKRFHCSVPRYTSYPTAPQFYPLGVSTIAEVLRTVDQSDRPLSLYVHIPFCRTMCLFCGCSVILNRRPERQAAYVDLLCREIELLRRQFAHPKRVTQLHFGGGTPTMLTEEELAQIVERLQQAFIFDGAAEISIEIDPRTVYEDQGKKLRFLHRMGFNRVSFGVQDLDPLVQQAVRRHQSEEMTVFTYQLARELGFPSINLDLIYGLPYQTRERFRRTAEKIARLQPDRIALFSYAKIPWLKKHQLAMPEEAEPSTEEKFQIYVEAREVFIQAGFTGIGLDHFALSTDSLARAYREKTLWRNFQGYSLCLAEDLIGLGITSIGSLPTAYLQNVKTIEEYTKEIEAERLPLFRGFILSEEDVRRRWVIQTLMCHFELDKREFQKRFGLSFHTHFASSEEALRRFAQEGLLEETEDALLPTELGRLFIRLIASAFDAYLKPTEKLYSQSV